VVVRIAVALGSGGARGYAHIGVINELEQRGYEIVSVAGSSMGALVGGAFAAGELAAYTDWVRGLSGRDVLRQLDPSLSSRGVIHAERVVNHVVELIGDRQIEDLHIRFTAVAVDLLAGREVWLDEGSLAGAIRASISIPGFITPAVVQGRLLVDGGVLDPVPVVATAAAGADMVVAVSLHGRGSGPGVPVADEGIAATVDRRACFTERPGTFAASARAAARAMIPRRPPQEPVPATGAAEGPAVPTVRMFETLSLSLEASQTALTRYCLAAYPPDVLISIPKNACRTMDFHRADEMIDLGRRLAEEALDGLGPPSPAG